MSDPIALAIRLTRTATRIHSGAHYSSADLMELGEMFYCAAAKLQEQANNILKLEQVITDREVCCDGCGSELEMTALGTYRGCLTCALEAKELSQETKPTNP